MKNRLLAGLVFGVMTLGVVEIARAAIIVDTGTPTTKLYGFSMDMGHGYAGEFSLSQANIITGIEGYLWGSALTPFGGTLTAAIFNDGGDVPGSELYSRQFTAGTDLMGWYGPSGLSWLLQAGTYWVSFDVRAGDDYRGAMPYSAPDPLAKEAFYWDSPWKSRLVGIGVKITGDPVPVPPTIILFGTGIAGLVVSRFRRKK